MKYLLILLLLVTMAIPGIAEEEDWSIWEVIEINTEDLSEAAPVLEIYALLCYCI